MSTATPLLVEIPDYVSPAEQLEQQADRLDELAALAETRMREGDKDIACAALHVLARALGELHTQLDDLGTRMRIEEEA